ncbi:MAG: ABC transporter ATP-binding protein [Elusimicrobia bacterium]|nr:ABC transporter ATP-binding protein [Elusimicrobiota bacterium]
MPDGPLLRLEGITKSFGSTPILKGISLEVQAGEFLTLLGPSGCGKTTTLRVIAGFEHPDSGRVFLGGADVTDQPAYRRDVHTVFQQYALFPHLDVFENVAFGLRLRGVGPAEIEKRVREALGLVKLAGFERRKISQVSGGQQQRVAVARSLVGRPSLLLLDEPLGALDLKLRKAMQLELKAIQRQLGLAFIYVTHDQEEALTMSDRIAVFNHGEIEQLGKPKDIYERPRSSFVADFIGAANILDAKLSRLTGDQALLLLEDEFELQVPRPDSFDASEGDVVRVAIRPERIEVLFTENLTPVPGPFYIPATLREAVYLGSATQIFLSPFKTGRTLVATTMDPIEAHLNGDAPGRKVWLQIRPSDIRILERNGAH